MKIVFNHPMCLIVEQDNSYVVKIRMRDGQYALQAPYPADQRGLLGAMMLATDVLAGKVLLVGVEASNSPKINSPKLFELNSKNE